MNISMPNNPIRPRSSTSKNGNHYSDSQLAVLAAHRKIFQQQQHTQENTYPDSSVALRKRSGVIDDSQQSRCTMDEMSSLVMRNPGGSKNRQHSTSAAAPVTFDFTEVFVWGDDSFGQLGLYH